MSQEGENYQKVEFIEIRRLNSNDDLNPYTIMTSSKEIKELYKKFNDSRYAKSAPIPVLDEGEYFLVLRPKLKKIPYGDVEIKKLEATGSTLNVFYKEVKSLEYEEKKQSNPVLILKILDNPKKIKLISI
ncbi:hypothetical protein NK356_10710 [Chryseobacterium sp. S0630]|uniref:hypothetical protein n=1 Tax=unclassified Chryseobacterium TaxID=2593645 RepID=UPI000B018133|nr:hypothetical protein [Chryseobacterium sp. S0630]MCP1299639.1 hypothetical protein [Chryseobacterium sp. S0630]